MRLLLILLSILSFSAIAQEPAHVIIGSKELSNFEIYDLTQDRQGHLILATDKGLLRYDAYEFKNLPLPANSKGTSLFGFSRNPAGEIFCHNLNGQLFKVLENEVKIAYQVPDSISNNTYNLLFDNEGNIVSVSRRPYIRTPEGEIKFFNTQGQIRPWELGGNFELLALDCSENLVYKVDENGTTTIPYQTKINEDCPLPGRYQTFDKESSLFVSSRDSSFKILSYSGELTEVSLPDAPGKVYNLGENGIWVAMSKGGVCVFDQNLKPQFKGKVLFKDEFISSAMVDRLGKVALGTFKGGVIYITNPSWTQYPGFNENRISFITGGGKNGVVAGTYSGQVALLDTNLNIKIMTEADNRIVTLDQLPGEAKVIFNCDKGSPTLINLNSGELRVLTVPSIKGISKLEKNRFLIGTMDGVYMNTAPVELNQWERVTEKLRTLTLAADTQNGIQYLGMSSGLEIWFDDYDTTLPFLVASFAAKSDTFYAGSLQNGILVFHRGKLIKQYKKDDGLADSYISKIAISGQNLFISTLNSFQILDLNSGTIKSYGKSEGLPTGEISDFLISQGYLWLLTRDGLQLIPLDEIKSEKNLPELKLKRLLINDEPYELSAENTFNHNQRQIKFELSCFTFTGQDQIRYKYKLDGIDPDWQYQPFEQNIITYKSLPPGEFKLAVLPIIENQEGEAIFYSFRIKPAIWQTWWFYLVLFVVLIASSFAVYRIYIGRKFRSIKLQNELNQSKLTAIRSQMNPHFIFNALNSIQDLVLKKDIEHAYSYITKFANLVRKTLTYSEKEFVDFEQEVQLIELYLSLERLRFKDQFEYDIETNGISDLKVAPMLIQPFIENALVHGLLHKDGEKKISIRFELKESLICKITDNGVGREESAKIRRRQRGGHDSFSTRAIKDRLNILSQRYYGKVALEYTDLTENGRPTGTRVTLYLPYERSL